MSDDSVKRKAITSLVEVREEDARARERRNVVACKPITDLVLELGRICDATDLVKAEQAIRKLIEAVKSRQGADLERLDP